MRYILKNAYWEALALFVLAFPAGIIVNSCLDYFFRQHTFNFGATLLGSLIGALLVCSAVFIITSVRSHRRVRKVVGVYGIEFNEAAKLVCIFNYGVRVDPEDWNMSLFWKEYQEYKRRGLL